MMPSRLARRELPDLAALIPRWISAGIISSFVQAGIYDNIRTALNGSGMIKGLKYGLIMALFYILFCAAFPGIFNLPDTIWGWWVLEAAVIYAFLKVTVSCCIARQCKSCPG